MADRARRGFRWSLVLLVLGAALCLMGSAVTWATVTVDRVAGIDATTQVAVSGREAMPVVAAMGVVALAGVVAVLATRGWVRVVVGVVLLLAGLAASVGAVAFAASPASFAAVSTGGVVDRVVATGWCVAAAAGGALIAASGGWTAARGRAWPGMGARYDRRPVEESASGDAWEALDRGQDPTDMVE